MTETSDDAQTVTEADRVTAAELRFGPVWRSLKLNQMQHREVERIARGLAAERAKARAPFLALADDYDRDPNFRGRLSDAIRRAAEDGQ